MNAAVRNVASASGFHALDNMFIDAVLVAVADAAVDDAALGQDVRALAAAFQARESELAGRSVR